MPLLHNRAPDLSCTHPLPYGTHAAAAVGKALEGLAAALRPPRPAGLLDLPPELLDLLLSFLDPPSRWECFHFFAYTAHVLHAYS